MATVQELEQLVQHIRRTLPTQQALTQLEPNEDAGVVQLSWHARHYVVKPTLEVFELKGVSLFVTGASMLLEATLRTTDRNAKVVGAILQTMLSAEESMRGNPQKGAALLEEVKNTLLRLAGKPTRVARSSLAIAGR